ncbi:MAG: polysaccharide deacetylase family protein [Planctomycetes bacterium]|nr:polysaccharide deacetylase family protein [Planctomycetota bacterium]
MNLALLGGAPLAAGGGAALALSGADLSSAAIGAGAGLSCGWLGLLSWGAVAPGAQLFGPAVVRGPAQRARLALTFDDGPNPPHTDALLAALAAAEARATFFVCGANAAAHPELIRRIAAAGHAIGNHGWSHRALVRLPARAIRAEIDRTQELLADLIGRPPELFRPPYGFRDPRVLAAARARGLTTVLWSGMAWDWRRPGAERIAQALLSAAAPGAILLLHDGDRTTSGGDRGQTVSAVRRVLPVLHERGLAAVTVPELLAE